MNLDLHILYHSFFQGQTRKGMQATMEPVNRTMLSWPDVALTLMGANMVPPGRILEALHVAVAAVVKTAGAPTTQKVTLTVADRPTGNQA